MLASHEPDKKLAELQYTVLMRGGTHDLSRATILGKLHQPLFGIELPG